MEKVINKFKEKFYSIFLILILLCALSLNVMLFILIGGILVLFVKFALKYWLFTIIFNYFGGILISYEILYILLGYSINFGVYLNMAILFLSGLINIKVCLFFSKEGIIMLIFRIIIYIIKYILYLIFFIELISKINFIDKKTGWELLLTNKNKYKNDNKYSLNNRKKLTSEFEKYEISKNLFQRL